MCDYLKDAFFTILGGLVSGLIGVLLFLYQRKRGARDAFQVFVSLKKSEIPKHGTGSGWDFYNGTKTEIREAIFKTVPFLCKSQRIRLEKLWAEYTSPQTQINLKEGHDGGSASLASEIGKSSSENPKWDRFEKLHDFMDRFSKAVDHQQSSKE